MAAYQRCAPQDCTFTLLATGAAVANRTVSYSEVAGGTPEYSTQGARALPGPGGSVIWGQVCWGLAKNNVKIPIGLLTH